MRNSTKTMTCKFFKNKWQQKQWNRDKVNVMHQQDDKFGHQQMVTAPSITTLHSSDDTIFCVAKIEPKTTKEFSEIFGTRFSLSGRSCPVTREICKSATWLTRFFFAQFWPFGPARNRAEQKSINLVKKKGRSADLELEARRRAARFLYLAEQQQNTGSGRSTPNGRLLFELWHGRTEHQRIAVNAARWLWSTH